MSVDQDRGSAAPICLFCGETERVRLFEVWTDHEFMIETCCPAMHDSLVQEMADDPAWAAKLLRTLEIEAITGYRIRRVADDGGCGLILDWHPRVQPIPWAVAQSFIRRHHAHCDAPVARRFGASVWNGGTLLGVVSVGSPVARALCGRGIIEVNRLCIRRDVPRALAWNGASMLYGWAAKEAAARGWSRIITYTRNDEDGASLRAAGWQREAVVRGRGWHSARRSRTNANAWIDKVRWGRTLQPRRARQEGKAQLARTKGNELADRLFSTSKAQAQLV